MMLIDQPNVSFSSEGEWHSFLNEMLKVKYAIEEAKEQEERKDDIVEIDRVIAVAKSVIRRFDDAAVRSDFDESEHPRGSGGKFEDKGGSEKGGSGGSGKGVGGGSAADKKSPKTATGVALTGAGILSNMPEQKPRSVGLVELANELNTRAQGILKEELGVDRITEKDHNEKTDEYLADVIALDLKAGLTNGHSAETWYSDKMKETMDIAGKLHPEMVNDPDKKFVFRVALAITSQGEVVDSAARLTELTYDRFNQDGKFPTDLVAKSPDINDNFKKLNGLLDEGMSISDIEKTFAREYTVKELKDETGYKIGKTNADAKVYGSAILGPKIGQGFYQNLSGNFKPLTMDLWFMRSWGRITGTLIGTPDMKPITERFFAALKDEGQKIPRTTPALIDLAKQLTKEHEIEYKKSRTPKSELTHAAVAFYTASVGRIVQTPTGGGQRQWMTNVFDLALKKLNAEGIKLSPASAQATWWTPEKILYAKLGVQPGVGGPDTDYAKSFHQIAADRGIKV